MAVAAFPPVGTTAASPKASPRQGWDTPERSPAQERFYRELMAAEQLPSAPEIAQRMLVAVNREDSNATELATLIARDQSLTARLLRLANSAFFAIRTRVTSIGQAVTLLGFTRVRDIALGLSVWGALDAKDPAGRRYRRRMWIHSATVAATAKMLCERTDGDGATAFTAGLLHDVGKLVLGMRLGQSYWALLDEAVERGECAATVETEAFGCHHATIGGWLLQIWQLPPALVDPVALHHEPLVTDFGLDVTAAVAVANRLVDATDAQSGMPRAEVLAEVKHFAPGLLGTPEWQEMYANLVREQRAVEGIFDG
jgi:putative nucleotidyltransferase with HDIG domain